MYDWGREKEEYKNSYSKYTDFLFITTHTCARARVCSDKKKVSIYGI